MAKQAAADGVAQPGKGRAHGDRRWDAMVDAASFTIGHLVIHLPAVKRVI